jgi:hypothetical protein
MVVGIALWAGGITCVSGSWRCSGRASQVVLIPEKRGSAAEYGGSDLAPVMRGNGSGVCATNLEGKQVSLADYKAASVGGSGQPGGPCKVEMPWFEEFRKQWCRA